MKIRFPMMALCAAVCVAAGAAGLSSCAGIDIPQPRELDVSSLPDGSYEGGYDAAPLPVKARVRVRLAGGRMESIEILSHDCSPIGKKGEAVLDRVVAAQSLSVDVVSGATGSSLTLLKAVESALVAGGAR